MEISHFYFQPRVRRNIRHLFRDLGWSSVEIADLYHTQRNVIEWCLHKFKIWKTI
jgi:hypothetical protein